MSAGSGAQERMLAELERLKEQAGLSFAQLQAAVPYSRSALHRYFTGQSAIPRDALVAVVRACDGDEAPMVGMWEAAQSDPALNPGAGAGSASAFGTGAPPAPVGPGGPVAAAGGDGRIRATVPYIQSSDSYGYANGYRSAWATEDPTVPLPATPAPDPVATPNQAASAPSSAICGRSDSTASAGDSDSTDSAPTRQRAIRAWFALAFVIVAIMAVRPLIDSSPQSSAATPVTPITDQSQSQSQDPATDPADAVPSGAPSSVPSSVPSPSKPTSHGTSQSVPPEVTIVSDRDNGRILTLRAGSIVEVALTDEWAKIKVSTDGSLIRTTPPVAAPWARQVEAFVVGTSGVSTSFCAYPISRGFTTIPGSVCLPWPGNRPFNVTIVRA